MWATALLWAAAAGAPAGVTLLNRSYTGVTTDFFDTTGHDSAERKKLPWELIDTYPDDLIFQEDQRHPPVKNPDGSTTVSMFASLRKLAPGEVVFTDPIRTKIPMPKGNIAVTSVEADVVDEKHEAVPLEEVYMHHWIMLDKEHPNDGVCGGYLKYIFGVGAETRTTPYDWPAYNGKHYGWFTNEGKEHWTANIHVIRTTNAKDVKSCIECHGPNKYCKTEGGFMCCPDHSFCDVHTTGGPSDEPKQYFFRYRVTYFQQTDADVVQGLNYILDVSHPKCNIEYNIKANNDGIDRAIVHTTLPHDARFFQLWGHIHIAGYNITLYHGADTSARPICTSNPIYGTKVGVVGNEKGYIVGMTKCKFLDRPYIIKKGETVTLEAVYNVGETDSRTWLTGGYHDGVMGLFFMTGEKCKTAGCVAEDDAPLSLS